MALRPLTTPYSMNAATLTIEADDVTEAVSNVVFAPSVQSSTWRGIGGNVRRAQSASEWALTLGYAQDLSPTGLGRYLHDNEGQTRTVVLTPIDGGPSVTAEIIVTPGTIGGTAGADLATAEATLAVDGKPAFLDPLP